MITPQICNITLYLSPKYKPMFNFCGHQRFRSRSISSSAVRVWAVSVPSSERVGQVALGVVELDDFLLDRVGGDEAVDRDRAGLADAVGAVGGLVLHRRVPPGVHVDHVVGGGEVQAEAAGLEGDQEQVALAILEGVDPLLAGLGRGLSRPGTGSGCPACPGARGAGSGGPRTGRRPGPCAGFRAARPPARRRLRAWSRSGRSWA